MRVAVAGPYGHERVTAWQDGADAQRKNTAGGFVSSGRARAPDGALARLCRKRPFTTQADRPRPRLKGGQLGGPYFGTLKIAIRVFP